MSFYEIYAGWKPAPSGGIFRITDERFATKVEAESMIEQIYAKDTINIGSGVYQTRDLVLFAQKLTERLGAIFWEFT